jgi:hypothetical protein
MNAQQELSDNATFPSRFMFIIRTGWVSVHADDCPHIDWNEREWHVIDAPNVGAAIAFDAEDRTDGPVYRVAACAKMTHVHLVRA